MKQEPWRDGRVGRLAAGRYAGRFVRVEPDRGGFHLWLTTGHPDAGPSDGWDAWVDDEGSVAEWFATELASVEWLD
jgi:hypothetical protein